MVLGIVSFDILVRANIRSKHRCGALSDKIGRNYAVIFAGLWGILGQALEASAQNASWMLCARVIAGVGTGGISAVIPVWSSELVAHDARGMVIAFEMVVNFAGISASCECPPCDIEGRMANTHCVSNRLAGVSACFCEERTDSSALAM